MGDCETRQGAYQDSLMNLESLRKSLVRQEDTIIFSLIERSNYPINSLLYDRQSSASFFHCFLKESEAVHAKAGRYTSLEENAFFPDDLPPPLLPPPKQEPALHPSGACININEKILDLYMKTLLPLIAAKGDDGNYAATAANDLACLQALSRRIHFGKFVAEVKFRDAPQDYTPAIRAKDREALMKLLTFESVEEMIKKRVEKKAMVFGQDVQLQENESTGKYKVKPEVVSQLYGEWVMPLTKIVQVEYLLRRLD
ncbi:chorismate mutase 2 [Perilla frutescens var. hirtella]|uniref:Chorismate mutase n=1 Tax=Perilla frutescens var. hirtella TaxID=608512 RepID=A0AAD4JMC1_PERFH|nr:chorismate mutase 2 [Perilla frutescens var. hirtella]